MVGSVKIAAFRAIGRAYSELPRGEREQARDAADKQMEEMLVDQAEKIRENRARRAASRQGLKLLKSRRRDPRALDFGMYALVDQNNVVVYGATERFDASLDDIEKYLAGE
jgi:hypothetical protein